MKMAPWFQQWFGRNDSHEFKPTMAEIGEKPHTSRELAGRVDEVLDDPNRKRHLGKKARRDIVEKYEVEDKIGEYQDLCRSLTL